MSEKFYDILADDRNHPDRWFLDEPIAEDGCIIDARVFIDGRPYNGPAPHFVPVQQAGRMVAFNLGAFDMPVVTNEIGGILEELSPQAIQRFPIVIDPDTHGFEVINVPRLRRCVDETRAEFISWTAEDNRPEKVGHYRMFTKLRIDPKLVQGEHIFRIEGWEIALIASDTLRSRLERIEDLGVRFSDIVD